MSATAAARQCQLTPLKAGMVYNVTVTASVIAHGTVIQSLPLVISAYTLPDGNTGASY